MDALAEPSISFDAHAALVEVIAKKMQGVASYKEKKYKVVGKFHVAPVHNDPQQYEFYWRPHDVGAKRGKRFRDVSTGPLSCFVSFRLPRARIQPGAHLVTEGTGRLVCWKPENAKMAQLSKVLVPKWRVNNAGKRIKMLVPEEFHPRDTEVPVNVELTLYADRTGGLLNVRSPDITKFELTVVVPGAILCPP